MYCEVMLIRNMRAGFVIKCFLRRSLTCYCRIPCSLGLVHYTHTSSLHSLSPVEVFFLTHSICNTIICLVSSAYRLQILFVISKPDVFKSPNSETYVIFGEAKIEDLSSQLQSQAAQQFRMPELSSATAKADPTDTAPIDEDEEDIDDSGVEPRDIELVMTQAGVSKGKAVKALKNSDGDIVSAIMELTA